MCWSHPTRVRGLKPGQYLSVMCQPLSHPTRVRGLKLDQLTLLLQGALRRTPRGCVD